MVDLTQNKMHSTKIGFKGSEMYVTLEPCSHYGLTTLYKFNKKKYQKVYYCFTTDIRTFKS